MNQRQIWNWLLGGLARERAGIVGMMEQAAVEGCPINAEQLGQLRQAIDRLTQLETRLRKASEHGEDTR